MEETLYVAEKESMARSAAGSEAESQNSVLLRVEHMLYFVALLIALGLRAIGLGEAPLAPLEAVQAWPASLAATGTQVAGAPAPISALFYGLQSWLFWIAGSGDGLARLLPALAGIALVLLPWWWRPWLGRNSALAVAFLLALDPWLVALSRTGDSAMLTIALALLALTALWFFLAGGQAGTQTLGVLGQAGADGVVRGMGAERVLAVSLGLLLVSGPLAWSWLPVLALFAWLVRTRVHRHVTWTGIRPSTSLWFGAALLLGASGFLAWPNAFSAAGSSLSVWLSQWSSAGDSGLGIGWPFLRLVVDQPLLLVFGPIGLILLATILHAQAKSLPVTQPLALTPSPTEYSRRRLTLSPPHPLTLSLFLALWAAWGLLLVLLPGRSAFVLPMLGLPLLIAAGVAIATLLALPLKNVGWLELALLLAVAIVLLIAGSIWLALAVESAGYDTRLALTAAALAGLTLAIWIVFGFWAGWREAGKVAGLFFATVLALVSVRSTTLLVQPGGRMAPDGLFPVTTLHEARLLATDVQRISSIRFGDPFEAPVQVATAGEAPDALVGWLLRQMVNLTWVPAPDISAVSTAGMQQRPSDELQRPSDGRAPLIVAPAGMEQDRGLGGMIGADYPLTMRWEPSLLPSMPPADESNANGLPPEELARLRSEQSWNQATRPQLEWLLYRTIRTEPAVESVTLWAMP